MTVSDVLTLANLRAACVLAASILVSGCNESLPLSLDKGTSAHAYCLSGVRRDVGIQPGTETHQALAAWITENRGGWEPYLATPPALGVIVRADGFSLQFVGSVVIAHVEQGVLTKTAQESSYAFLSSQCGN
ncbi:hypothetical protein ACS5PN_30455 [Roseateles sp. NT4]|uniref:hypothetical protein n=1 Tax=Roseateles sp. NT4 TaxID=3453715 RepID=UPI003EEDC5E6